MYAGTSEEVLQKGAGHLEGSSLPIGGAHSYGYYCSFGTAYRKIIYLRFIKGITGDTFYIHNFAEI